VYFRLPNERPATLSHLRMQERRNGSGVIDCGVLWFVVIYGDLEGSVDLKPRKIKYCSK